MPSEPPEISLQPDAQPQEGIETRLHYAGEEGGRVAGWVLRVAPGYTYSLEAGADQLTKFPAK